MARLFGTDGVRGVAITELTCELAMNIGRALAATVQKNTPDYVTPLVLIGKDTRLSSDILESALIAGLTSVGCDVRTIGVVPTHAVAFLIKSYDADAGVMITASHNSAEFNGIKLFNKEGFKFPDEQEDEMEKLIHAAASIPLKEGNQVGRLTRMENEDGALLYKKKLAELVNGKSNLKILIDCANGSASEMCAFLKTLSDNCTVINCSFDGKDINNNCGSTYIDNLAKQVVAEKYDLGLAFDGDADRLLAVDNLGNVVDGDKIIALLSCYMKEQGKLNNDTAVVTVMSNLGFHMYMKQKGIKTEVVQVGDRYVLEKMVECNYGIGGEQSGHIIFVEHATTGDGLITAVMLVNMLNDKGVQLSELAAEIPSLPQVLRGVTISADKKGTWSTNAAITSVIAEIEKAANVESGESRILIRESGTEPLLRVMIEGKNQSDIEKWAEQICAIAKSELS